MSATNMQNWDRRIRPTFAAPEGAAKPRIMIAGEFSAGKTKLISSLLGDRVLPSNVTATALPPVWITAGSEPAFLRVDVSGSQEQIQDISDIELDETQYCVMTHPAPFLKYCDIIDTPGSSDPNMKAESWQRMLGFADTVVWCTNATQAWRQSEKAIWKLMPERLIPGPMLVVTHADLVMDDGQRAKVQRRLERETTDFFETVNMVSLYEEDDIAMLRQKFEENANRIGENGSGEKNEIVLSFAHALAGASPPAAPEQAVHESPKKRSSVLRNFVPSRTTPKDRSQE